MNIQIGYPEICLVCATVLATSGLTTPFWVLFSISILGSIVRTALRSQQQIAEAQSKQESIDSVKNSVSNFFDALNASTNKNHTTH